MSGVVCFYCLISQSLFLSLLHYPPPKTGILPSRSNLPPVWGPPSYTICVTHNHLFKKVHYYFPIKQPSLYLKRTHNTPGLFHLHLQSASAPWLITLQILQRTVLDGLPWCLPLSCWYDPCTQPDPLFLPTCLTQRYFKLLPIL